VLINVVLATSGAALSSLASASGRLSGLVRSLSGFYFDSPAYLLAVGGVVLVVSIALTLLLVTMWMWSGASPSRAQPYHSSSRAAPRTTGSQTKKKPGCGCPNRSHQPLSRQKRNETASLVWRFLRLAMYDWALILLLQLFAGTVSALMGY